MSPRFAAVVSALVLAAACEGTAPVESDALNHTEDCTNLVSNWGTVPWGDAGLEATYENDFETSRMFINVETPSDFQIEVTQKGSNRHLDLVMAVYDPDGNKVGSDDDSGWGRYPRLQVSAQAVGKYEVRVDPKLPATAEGGEVEFVRGKYRVELQCLSELCDVTAAQDFQSADVSADLSALLEGVDDQEPECEPIEDSDGYNLCTSKSAYAVRYTFNPALAPTLEEAAIKIKSDNYSWGYIGTGSDRADFAADLADFQISIDDVDALMGYSDYEVGSLGIDDDCSPDDCWGNWWYLHSAANGETYGIRLGYYQSPDW
jgi:hypothetical protein